MARWVQLFQRSQLTKINNRSIYVVLLNNVLLVDQIQRIIKES